MMSDMSRRSTAHDPRAAVRAPFVEALNGIVMRATLGFALVAGIAAVPLLVELDEAVHTAVHLVLPIGWVAYAAMAGFLNRRAGPIVGDPWAKASEAEPGLARFAGAVSGFMIGGWLAAVVAVLVHHHLSTPTDIALTFAVYVPTMVIPWGLASWAWSIRCRHALERAEARANDLFRVYWEGIGR
jgi:hypothetical protein